MCLFLQAPAIPYKIARGAINLNSGCPFLRETFFGFGERTKEAGS